MGQVLRLSQQLPKFMDKDIEKTIDVQIHKSKMLLSRPPLIECGMFLQWTVRPHLNRRPGFSALL
jgi:hypothetical protein